MIGKKLLHYEITEKLGEGGMGEVYRARDTKLSREVAIKLIPEHLSGDADRLKRFKREAAVIASLKHPNIVTIHSIEEADQIHFLTMELVEGKTLSEHIPPGGIPLNQLFKIAIPLTDAIQSAHVKGIAHRDLKPANIMIDSDGRVKVLDFGLAKLLEPIESPEEIEKTCVLESETGEGRIMGTVSYMSPEQAEGKPVDHRSDIFTLGIILHEMATGKRPFPGETRMSKLTSIIRDNPPSVTDIKTTLPVHLGRIVKRCLAKEPDRRYQASLDIRNELEGLQDEVATVEMQSTVTHSASAPRGVSRVGRFIGIGLAAVAIILASVFILPKLKGPALEDTATSPAEPISQAETTADRQSVAVLPFVNMSGNADNEYFSDGLAEELLHLLSKVSGLRVAARTSSFHFKGQTGMMKEIGEKLNVATILEGSVRRSGNQVRITAQLINTDDGFHLWSETYDRELNDIFAIQEDIATQVVEAMKITLLGEDAAKLAQRPTDNLDAYDAYLLGQQQLARRNSEALEDAAAQFQRAIDLDPKMAMAYAGRAQALLHLESYGTRTAEENESTVSSLITKAMSLDDQSGVTHAVKGLWKRKRYDSPGAIAAYEKAIELNPNYAMSYMWYASTLGFTDPAKRRRLLDKALELDPLSPIVNVNSADGNISDGKIDLALEQLHTVLEVEPEFTVALAQIASIHQVYLDQPEEALLWQARAVESDPGNLGRRVEFGEMNRQLGRFEESRRIYLETIAIDPGYAPAYRAIGRQEQIMGRFDEAARWYRKGFDRDPSDPVSIKAMAEICLDLDDANAATRWSEYASRFEQARLVSIQAKIYIHVHRGELTKASSLLEQVFAEDPGRFFADKLFLDMTVGRYEECRAALVSAMPVLLEETPIVDRSTFFGAGIGACVFMMTGEHDRVGKLATDMETFLEGLSDSKRMASFDIGATYIQFLRGETDSCIDEYQKLVDAGRVSMWWEKHTPVRFAYRDNPRYRKMISDIREDLATMRAKLPLDILAAP